MSESEKTRVQSMLKEVSTSKVITPGVEELLPNNNINVQETLTSLAWRQRLRIPIYSRFSPTLRAERKILKRYQEQLHQTWSHLDAEMRSISGADIEGLQDILGLFYNKKQDSVPEFKRAEKMLYSSSSNNLPVLTPTFVFGSSFGRVTVFGNHLDLSAPWQRMKFDGTKEKEDKLAGVRDRLNINPATIYKEPLRRDMERGESMTRYGVFVDYNNWRVQLGQTSGDQAARFVTKIPEQVDLSHLVPMESLIVA